LVLTASCARAFKVPAARPAIVWRATMPPLVSQAEKDRRAAACREVIEFAGGCEAVGSITQCAVIVLGKTSLKSISGAEKELRLYKNALPEDDPLRAAYDAVVARSRSAEVQAAAARRSNAHGKNLPSVADMREARVAWTARLLPTLTVSGDQLRAELERAVPATAVTPQQQLEGMEECACLGAFGSAKAPFEAKVAVAE